jgi:raffinose/stachyose/melibiose transport system substrate-binding protein
MKKRLASYVILTTALAVALTGCSSGDNGGTANTSASSQPGTSAKKKNVTLIFQTLQTEKTNPQYIVEEEIANKYMKENPHVKIEWDRLDTEQQKVKLKTQAASGEVPDITMVNPGAQLQPFADGKVLVPLNDLLADPAVKDTYLKGILDYYTFDGNVYALPWNMNIAGIFYNKENFKKAGVELPETFEDIIAAVPKFKAAGIPTMMVAGKDRWPLSFMFTNILQRTNGGPNFLNDVVAGKKKFTDPAFVEAIAKTQDLIKAGAYQEGAATYDVNTTSQKFRDGIGAMYFMGTWDVAAIDASKVAGKVGFMPFPSVGGKGNPGDFVIAPGAAYALGANSKNLDESKAFLKYLVTNYPKVSFEKKAAVGLAQKVDGDFKAAGYSELAVEVMGLFNTVKGGDMNFDNVIEPSTTQTHLNGLQGLLVKEFDPAALAAEHQKTWDNVKKK